MDKNVPKIGFFTKKSKFWPFLAHNLKTKKFYEKRKNSLLDNCLKIILAHFQHFLPKYELVMLYRKFWAKNSHFWSKFKNWWFFVKFDFVNVFFESHPFQKCKLYRTHYFCSINTVIGSFGGKLGSYQP